MLLTIRNANNFLETLLPKTLKDISSEIPVQLYVYENNSTDGTLAALNRLDNCVYKHDPEPVSHRLFNADNIKYIESCKAKGNTDIGYRIEKICIARERLINKVFSHSFNTVKSLLSKWCVLVDADMIFDYNVTIRKLIDASLENLDGVMFCANSVTPNKDVLLTKYHEDTVVYSIDNVPFVPKYYYDTFAYNYGDEYGEKEVKFNEKVTSCTTAFGGVVLVRADVLLLSKWSTTCKNAESHNGYKQYGICEHYAFCEEVSRFGKIYVVKDSMAVWNEIEPYIKNNQQRCLNKFTSFTVKTCGILANHLNYQDTLLQCE